ncbi:hypothetical protein K493DRAFT_334838 [Basidiobolus meristosporus CBS 931.73]|uniref:UBR-type domain-containing protein n=1 Tax=Basidiobolus meristosporus CBS 931.73 TaxID=1314790 RepID=A0A1Y1YUY6_9FUNG|nr:hypothetical protein K493DRAFT_334838 [Basidiobolus meristosporus CBS 931.73]|eukprot:ORY01776.1 hypothetical protein K493DRAFT_334838 [Basidiobolus meristosporus CBS 931.73]
MNEEDVTTAVEFLEHQSALEAEAREQYPGKFERCTHSLGYLYQELYVCKTCTPDLSVFEKSDQKDFGINCESDWYPGAICYACSIACHADHELLELWSKRGFRCDCGLENKYPTKQCSLQPKDLKTDKNILNKYTHNFVGRYCWCNAIYDPDSDDSYMAQCSVCCDWFHDKCIGIEREMLDSCEGFICRDCTEKHAWLRKVGAWALQERQSIEEAAGSTGPTQTGSLIKPIIVDKLKLNEAAESQGKNASIVQTKRQPEETVDIETVTKKSKLESGADQKKVVEKTKAECKFKDIEPISPGACLHLLCNAGWKKSLCQCQECQDTLKQSDLKFLLEADELYEPEKDADAGKSLFECGMERLLSMNRNDAVDGLQAYNRFRDEIKAFLEPYAASGKVVTANDIEKFFQEKQLERVTQ